jgi:hypothetical protein
MASPKVEKILSPVKNFGIIKIFKTLKSVDFYHTIKM